MVLLEKLKNEIEIVPVAKEEIHSLVLKHYLKTWPVSITQIYGIYHKGSDRKPIGMAIYGYPQKPGVTSLRLDIPTKEVLELKRLFIEDIPTLPHIESYVLSKTLKMVKKEMPEIKVVITYADNREGHLGTIYQATNAIYIGKSSGQLHKYAYILRGDKEAIKAKLASKFYPKKN